MFDYVVRHLGFLKNIPLVAWLFDAMMMIWNMLFNPMLASHLEILETQVTGWEDITVTIHKYGGLQFNYKQKEIGHVHSNGVLDITFDRKTKLDLLHAGLVKDHHVFTNSGWVTFYIRTEEDADKAVELLALSYRRTADKPSGIKHIQAAPISHRVGVPMSVSSARSFFRR